MEYIYVRLIIRIKGGVRMEFLNKIYESNYFGIGLFAVISFLVIMFLIVLFFGKKDEKKRKLEETNKLDINNDAFKETSTEVPLDIKPNEVNNNSINFMPEMDIAPVAPLNYEEQAPMEEITPIEEPPKMEPVIDSPSIENNIPTVEPITLDVIPEEPIVEHIENVSNITPLNEPETITEPVNEEPVITPIIEDSVNYDFSSNEPATIIESTKFDLNSPASTSIPEVKPIIEEKEEPLNIIPTIVESTPIVDSYYQPKEETPAEEIKVPNIDFDALAKSISDELDELEKRTEVKVTPMSEIEEKPVNSLNSIYVAPPVNTSSSPSKIDLPTKKDE